MCARRLRRYSIRLLPALLLPLSAAPVSRAGAAQEQPAPSADSPAPAAHASSQDTNDVELDDLHNPRNVQEDLIAGTIDPAQREGAYGYGLWVLAPAIVALVVSLLFRQVLPGMFLGLLTGAYMLTLGAARTAGADSVTPAAGSLAEYARMHPALGGFRYGVEQALLTSIVTEERGHERAKLLLFILVAGFAVGVTARGGGMAGLANVLCGKTGSQRRGQMAAWASSVVLSPDPVAGRMTVGPMMQFAYDRIRLSRAKLAYLVDAATSSAGTLVMLGTWTVAEMALLTGSLAQLDGAEKPAFLEASNGASVFLGSMAYRFYAVFGLALALWFALLGRDFGPMWKAESRALSGQTGTSRNEAQIIYEHKSIIPRAWIGLLGAVTFIGMWAGLLVKSGFSGDVWLDAEMPLVDKLEAFIGRGDMVDALFHAAWGYGLIALLLTFVSRAASIREATEAGLEGMGRMVPALAVLVLSFGLARVCGELGMTDRLLDVLHQIAVPIEWMPLVIFAGSGVVALMSGSAWTSMALLTPVSVAVMSGMVHALPVEMAAHAEPLFLSGVGAVLGGAMFGAHCSPLSDTTILASAAAGCRHEEHVSTQIPYALLAAVLAAACGNVVTDVYHQPWYYALPAGCAAGLIMVSALGRKPKLLKDAIPAAAASLRRPQ